MMMMSNDIVYLDRLLLSAAANRKHFDAGLISDHSDLS